MLGLAARHQPDLRNSPNGSNRDRGDSGGGLSRRICGPTAAQRSHRCIGLLQPAGALRTRPPERAREWPMRSSGLSAKWIWVHQQRYTGKTSWEVSLSTPALLLERHSSAVATVAISCPERSRESIRRHPETRAHRGFPYPWSPPGNVLNHRKIVRWHRRDDRRGCYFHRSKRRLQGRG